MTKVLYLVVFLWSIVIVSCSKDKGSQTPPDPPTDTARNVPVSLYLTRARQTHDFIRTQLLTPYNSYKVNTSTNINSAFEWYNASQIYADAAMASLGDTTYLPYMNKTFYWMDHLWDHSNASGGYFAFGGLDGSGASGTKYVDDNSLTGVVYLTAYEVATGADRQAYLDRAKACADWVIHSGLWDNTFGGGFWWNTEKKK